MASLTVFPTAGTGGPTGDAYFFVDNQTPYSASHDAASGTADNTILNGVLVRNTQATNYFVHRFGATFDTSSLGTGATISSAVISLSADGGATVNANSDSIDSVGWTPSVDFNFVGADYSAFGTTSFGSMLFSAWVSTNHTYNDITLNASGISNISKTGNSKFGWRTENDRANTAPTGSNDISFYSSDATGTSDDPKLVITYTTSVKGGGTILMMGV